MDIRDEFRNELVTTVLALQDSGKIDRSVLDGSIYMLMDRYEISERTKELIVRDDDKIDYYIKKFLIAKKAKGLTDRSIKHYGTSLRFFFQNMQINPTLITADDIKKYVVKRELYGNVTKRTIQNEERVLSSFYQWMVDEEIMAKNPMKKVGIIKVRKEKKKALSDMDVEKIRYACRNTRETMIIEVLLSTACRITEFAHMKISDIEPDGSVRVVGKGEKVRTVYLNAKAQMAVEMYLKDRHDTNPYINPKSSLRFSNKNGMGPQELIEWYKNPSYVHDSEFMNVSSIGAVVRNIGKRAGVANCHPHRLRRTCATNALKKGMPIEYVSKMLGHESIETTQIYLDLHDEDMTAMHRKYVV